MEKTVRPEVFLQALISFIIVAFGHPSFVPWLAPISAAFGYALFWHAIRIYPFRWQAFWRGALWFSSVTLVQLCWMTSIEYQGVYILFVWVGLSVGIGAQFGLLTLLIPHNRKLSIPRILAIASVWTLVEWSRFFFLCGYSWNPSGIALSTSYALQLSTLFGVLGLSFWVLFSNLIGLRALSLKGIPRYALWLGVALLPYLYGVTSLGLHKTAQSKAQPIPFVQCALIQTGLLPAEKIPIQGKIRSFVSPYDQWKQMLFYLSEHQDKSLDIIVFPEAAVPFSSDVEIYKAGSVKQIFTEVFGDVDDRVFPKAETKRVSNSYWAQSVSNFFKAEVVIGLDHTEPDGHSYNSAFHFLPHGSKRARYDKRVLMPLAEYLPFKWLIPLVRYYGITDFFTPGKKALLFQGKYPFSTSICYEETFPEKMREGRRLGAQLLVNLTNDGWYPSSKLPSQHLEHARMRAVENGCSLVRACNTGVTAAIDPFGNILGKIDEKKDAETFEKGVLFASVPLYTYETPFTFWGNGAILGIALFFVALFLSLKKTFDW